MSTPQDEQSDSLDQSAEGWYRDPYHAHEHRWISNGIATKLVRDGDLESYDLPPDGRQAGPLIRIAYKRPDVDANEFRRADDAERSDGIEHPSKRILGVLDEFGDRD